MDITDNLIYHIYSICTQLCTILNYLPLQRIRSIHWCLFSLHMPSALHPLNVYQSTKSVYWFLLTLHTLNALHSQNRYQSIKSIVLPREIIHTAELSTYIFCMLLSSYSCILINIIQFT